MKNKDFDFDLDLPEEEAAKKFSFNDLDLGLDFDLSFLDDIDEPAPEPKEAPKPEPKPEPKPAQRPAPKAQKPAAPQKAPQRPAAPQQQGAPARKPAPKGTASQQMPPVRSNAPAKPQQPQKRSAPAQQPPVQEAPRKRGPRVGSVIFYTLYFIFILVFFLATFLGLNWLKGWLTDYEYAQPTVKAKQVFTDVFTNPDWAALYDSAGAEDSAYEGREQYVAYMQAKQGSTPLTYMETSAGMSGDKKFFVYLNDEKVASFTLVDKNKVGKVDLSNLENLEDLESMTGIPDWQLGAVEVFFERKGDYFIEMMDGYTATVNGVALDEKATIQMATTRAKDYLPEGTTGFSTITQQVSGLMEKPEIVVTDRSGNPVEVTYDEAARKFTARTESNTMSEEEKQVALEAAHVASKWMIEAVTDRGEVAKYFDNTSDAYSNIVKNRELWMQKYNGYEFANEEVTNYAKYSDNIFSVSVKTDLNVTRTDGTVRTFNFNQSMFFKKGDSGKWLCFESTNVDVSQPVGLVRLTFMNGETEIHSDLFETDTKEVITPVISIPDGQIFTGWVTVSENEKGETVYNLEFQPDATTGIVKMPEGSSLRPMVLYALFENAFDAAAQIPAEDVPAETAPAETTEGA